MTKYVFITGGVISSLGKGVVSASLGAVLQARDLRVTYIKLDPYLNVDPGTMSPYQHGEVFVTDDGTETDLDLGHYERFTGAILGEKNNYTTGKVYQNVITKERRGDYLGSTVQVIPHVTDEIKRCIKRGAYDCDSADSPTHDGYDVAIVEIGGVVGDIESLPFLEAIRQMKIDEGDNVAYVHLTLLPVTVTGELKTKPTQHSVKELRSIGIQPDVLICRADRELPDEERKKIALFTNVPYEAVITVPDVDYLYKVPLSIQGQVDEQIVKKLNLKTQPADMTDWYEIQHKLDNPTNKVTIAIVGKYAGLPDSYKSLTEALIHAGIHSSWPIKDSPTRINIRYIKTEELDEDGIELLKDVDGIIVPGGFGERGMGTKALAVKHARENDIPFLGLCLGMQLAMVEFARNVVGIEDAESAEANPNTPNPIIVIMDEGYGDYGGTLRLGGHEYELFTGSRVRAAYGQNLIRERCRHRYTVNKEYIDVLKENGMVVSGVSYHADRPRVYDHAKRIANEFIEVIELPEHRWFIGVQFHPELTSSPIDGHPLFESFINAACKYKHDKIHEFFKDEDVDC
ncbi:hypothetical protein LCGC14_0534040 [marine sediment metagenome]|uniref:CTP synthase n=1 Tax=marine sediment metagenome TaxID=412755 RepID=A0A0F9RUQ2_9ZZZZ